MNEKMKGNKVNAEEGILKEMINKRKSIENRRLYTTQSKNGIHLKRKKKNPKCQNKIWPNATGAAFGSGGYEPGWGSSGCSGECTELQ